MEWVLNVFITLYSSQVTYQHVEPVHSNQECVRKGERWLEQQEVNHDGDFFGGFSCAKREWYPGYKEKHKHEK